MFDRSERKEKEKRVSARFPPDVETQDFEGRGLHRAVRGWIVEQVLVLWGEQRKTLVWIHRSRGGKAMLRKLENRATTAIDAEVLSTCPMARSSHGMQ